MTSNLMLHFQTTDAWAFSPLLLIIIQTQIKQLTLSISTWYKYCTFFIKKMINFLRAAHRKQVKEDG